jgi:hypothetical protein
MAKRITFFVLAALAVVAVAVPAAGARSAAPSSDRFNITLEIFDLHVSTACDADVFANVSGAYDRYVRRDATGAVTSVTETFLGRITWFTRGSGKSYSSSLASTTRSEFPEGLDYFKPARITVTGVNGGTFPVGDGPPGAGTLVYDGFIYGFDDEDVPYTAVDGDPILKVGDFTTTTRRICAALA